MRVFDFLFAPFLFSSSFWFSLTISCFFLGPSSERVIVVTHGGKVCVSLERKVSEQEAGGGQTCECDSGEGGGTE